MTEKDLDNVKVFTEYFSLTPLIKCGNKMRVMSDEEVNRAVFGLAKYLSEKHGKNKLESNTEIMTFEFKKKEVK